ncbi:WhiB family transcriptional regulator [Streptomyces europaeiscabiei]|uniref:WhiB family transcriptional regulator n=1 Tax=Streptomyces europaeiscabiei TaxID=146819 RepID=UPI0038F6C134
MPLPCTEAPDAWHSDRTTGEAAERLCEGCPALLECRAYGLSDSRLSGVWGGLTEAERRRRRARAAERRRAAKVAA